MSTTDPSARTWDAIVVAGGRARRLGGIDKTALVSHGRSLLDGAVAAVSGARRICVVGSDARLPAAVLRTVEQPRWGGPAAAVVAGLDALAAAAGSDTAPDSADDSAVATWVMVLAGDLVRADDAVTALLAELDRVAAAPLVGAGAGLSVDGLISVDAAGRRQPLLAVYRRAALVSAARAWGTAENLSVMSLIGALNLIELPLAATLSDDVDTPADAARLGIELPAGSTLTSGIPGAESGTGSSIPRA